MGREGTCMDYKPHWVSNPKNRYGTLPKRVPAPFLFFTEMCIFGRICTPFLIGNQSFPGIADLWAVKALKWTTKPTRSPTPESRKSTQPKRVPAACLFYTEMCIFGHIICSPISRKPEFSRHSGACGLRVPPFYCKTH